MRAQHLFAVLTAACATVAAVPASAQLNVGNAEIRANQVTVSKQRHPVAAIDNAGRSLVVWENDFRGLQARFFNRNGQPSGPELNLVQNRLLPSIPARGDVITQEDPAVAFLPNGDFFVFWTQEKAFLTVDIFIETREIQDRDVMGQRFGRDGQPVGSRFRVNAQTQGLQSAPKVVARANSLVVVWHSPDGVFARRINPNGGLLGDEITLSGAGAANPDVAADASGNFLVVWDAADASGTGVFGQLFDRAGVLSGAPFRISTDTVGNQRAASVAAGRDGSFFVVWHGQTDSPRHARIFGQVVGAGGNLIGAQVAVSSETFIKEVVPSVAPGRDGRFLVTWLAYDETFPRGYYGVEISALGAVSGSEIKLNKRAINANTKTAIGADGKGLFVIPWEGFVVRQAGISVQFANQ